MKIGFTIDTNLIENKDPKINSLSKNLSFYLNYIKALEKMDKENSLKFFISEIVLKEMIAHKKDGLEEEYESSKNRYLNYAFIYDGEFPKSRVNELIKEEKRFGQKLNILEIPKTSEKFTEIIDYAINKKAPFVKSNGDKGFKDTLLWESILESNEINELDKFYFFTGDNDFCEHIDDLIKEFKEKHKNCEFLLKKIDSKESEKRNEALITIINENKLMETNITRLFDENNILEYIKKVKTNNVQVRYKSEILNVKILFKKFKIDDFSIEDVIEKEDNMYEFLIKIRTSCYEKKLNDQIYANLNMTLKSENETFELVSSVLNNVRLSNPELEKYLSDFNEFSNMMRNYGEDRPSYKDIIDQNDLIYRLISKGKEIGESNKVVQDFTEKLVKVYELANTINNIDYVKSKIAEVTTLLGENENK